MHGNSKLGLAAVFAFFVFAAAGCQSPPPTPPAPPAPPPPPTTPVPPDAGTEMPALPTAAEDTCQAASHASLVGQDYKQAPPAPAGKVIRVLCATCAMTMDFNAERLNVIYDDKSGRIVRLTCG